VERFCREQRLTGGIFLWLAQAAPETCPMVPYAQKSPNTKGLCKRQLPPCYLNKDNRFGSRAEVGRDLRENKP